MVTHVLSTIALFAAYLLLLWAVSEFGEHTRR